VKLWPAAQLGEALATLSGAATTLVAPANILENEHWIEAAARSLGFEAVPAETSYAGFDAFIGSLDLAIIRVGDEFIVGKPSVKSLRPMLCGPLEAGALEQVERMLDRAGIPAERRERARNLILRERLATARIRGIWRVRLPPSASFWLQLRRAGIPQRVAVLTSAHAVQYILWIAAWFVVGRNVLQGHSDPGWLLRWAVLLLALVPLRVLITWLQGRTAIAAGALLKLRLFFGALRLDPDEIRHQGAGQLLGRVIESEAVEALALSGGFLGLVAIVELAVSIFVLSSGASGVLAILLAAWIAFAAIVGRKYYERNRTWTDVRLAMTHDLVENMVGHRTRLAQLHPRHWHDGEEVALERYLRASKSMDRYTTILLAVIPRGWLMLALICLAPVAAPTTAMAISLGGILLSYRSLKRFAAGAWQLAGAAVAWERVRILYNSATRAELNGSLDAKLSNQPVVDAEKLSFRYSDHSEPVLRGCNLRILSGDRLILEGESGGGKSTLAGVLIGLREPNSGRLLTGGLNRQTLGAQAWRSRIAAAPQFHENHVLADTFAFNLFMGRKKPPGSADLADAEELCRELGLDDLLARMPAGMLQLVGETGWQLSHGEKSRLYIARAILQDPELIVLDESFAALDPENLQRAVECVTRRAKTLLVIAHK
jgi:ATP-binding cassette subfamily B protein